MDMRSYYKKVREAAAAITTDPVVVISLETPEGGKAGVRTETSKANAARLLAEARARLATDQEAADFRRANTEARADYLDAETARKVQITVVPHHREKPTA